MSDSHGYGGGPAHGLVDDGPGVRQLGHVVEGGEAGGTQDALQLLLHACLHLRIADRVDQGPQQRVLHGFEAGAEEVQ